MREFVRAGRGFTAELWNEEFNGVQIEVVVNGQNAADASLVNEENNRLRVELTTANEEVWDQAIAAIPEVGVTFPEGYEEWVDAPSYRESVVAALEAARANESERSTSIS